MHKVSQFNEKQLCIRKILEAFLMFQLSHNSQEKSVQEIIYTQYSQLFNGLSNQFFICLFIDYQKLALFYLLILSVFFNYIQKKERELFYTDCKRNIKFIPYYQIFKYEFLFLINKFKLAQGVQCLKTHSKKEFIYHF
ncbi:unnamed protein product [Paramecium primaurelia]|uniref:Transmembrane protein n=1 Tax=Paramecium primaurelia TaxID=5886 RepID=A0A8S1QJY9_PARPR|nr:unnamed protein product [Paramecium primaurelia]